MKKCILLLICVLSFQNIFSEDDTLTIMHYNLMYYDRNTDFCTSTNNNVDLKDGYLSTTLNHVKPDILTVNEVNGSIASVQRILTNTLNINGINYYKRDDFSGSYLVNMIYYNSNKLELKKPSFHIGTQPRQTDIYRLYLKTDKLVLGDTIFLTCFVTHLKAGSTSSDENDRTSASQQIMNYIVSNNITGNILLMGDMNLYSSSEQAFINFTTIGSTGFRFYDPINMVGEWHDNYYYKNYHSQSTHTSSSGCHSTGGFDDRFDFILSSGSVLQGSNGLTYKKYFVLGQDGNRYNQSLLSPTNTSLPNNVINSLYEMSDHLPIIMKLAYQSNSTSVNNMVLLNSIRYNNPVRDNLKIEVLGDFKISGITIYSLIGNSITTYSNQNNNQKIDIPTNNLTNGVYIMNVQFSNGKNQSYKFIIYK